MQDIGIRDKCRINTNFESDTFVGLRYENNDLSINFPMGYHLAESEKELRQDIFLLFATLSKHTKNKDSNIFNNRNYFDEVQFPIQSYIYLIRDYYERGYYKEKEVNYHVSKKGKINWNRTIKTQKPYVQNNDIFYLEFVTKKNNINEDELITLVHEYLVYESFIKIGWLFTKALPIKPRIKRNNKLFKSVIIAKISSTYNDKNRLLFRHMLAIVENSGNHSENSNFIFGTYRFEYVWESMIDKVFGIKGKEEYFPKTEWLLDDKAYENASLEPDTIMVYKNDVYVLDAKYYKYGIIKNPRFLPESTSINKQITYGEYIHNNEKFFEIHGKQMQVYNAFIMPYNASQFDSRENIIKVGEAISNWKDNGIAYQKIQGILIDVKYLMKIIVEQSEDEIYKIAVLIKGEWIKEENV